MSLVPEEAIEAAALALRSPSHRAGPPDPDLVEIWKRAARITLSAAAPLIVAAWLDDRAKRMDDAATRSPTGEDSWDRGWNAAWMQSADMLRTAARGLRASALGVRVDGED